MYSFLINKYFLLFYNKYIININKTIIDRHIQAGDEK